MPPPKKKPYKKPAVKSVKKVKKTTVKVKSKRGPQVVMEVATSRSKPPPPVPLIAPTLQLENIQKATAAGQKTLDNLQSMTDKVIGSLTPKEKEVLEKRFSASPPVLLTKLPAEAQEVRNVMLQLGAEVNLLTVNDEAAFQRAGEMVTQLKALDTRLDNERKKLTAPLKEQAKRIEALFRPTSEQLEDFINQLKRKLLDFHTTKQQQLKEQQTKLLEQAAQAQAAGDHDTAVALATQHTELAPMGKTTMLDTGVIQMREPWTFEVVDLGLVPREYMSLDEAKVRAAVKAGMRDDVDENGKLIRCAITGIRIFQKTTVAVGAGPLLG